MKKLIQLVGLMVIFCLAPNYSYSQQNENDTIRAYLIKQAKILLKPHSDLNFAFSTDELKNEAPDLNVKVPNLNDTTKYFDELKGDYKDWEVFYKIGKLYQRFDMPQPAFAHFEQAYNLIFNEIKKDSLNPEYYSEMGMLYMSLNSNENAYYFFNKAYELDTNDSLSNQFLPMFLTFSGKLDKADEMIDASIKNRTASLSTYIWMVTTTVFKSLDKLDSENKSLLQKPIDELFDFSRLNAAVKNNKSDISFLVLEQLSRQLALFAKYGVLASGFDKIELTSSDTKDLKKIRKSLEKFITKGQFKNRYVLYKALGFNYLLEKDYKKSINYFKKAIINWPADKNSKDYYILFTTHYFIQNDTTAALKVIDSKIEHDSALVLINAYDYVLKANIYLERGQYHLASANYNKALEIGKSPMAYLGLAFIKIEDGNLEEANALINKAYETNQQYYLTYALFGVITLLNNQKEEAKNAFGKALELKPDEKTLKEIYQAFWGE